MQFRVMFLTFFFRFFLPVIFLMLFAGNHKHGFTQRAPVAPFIASNAPAERWADSVLNSLSASEKIAQLIMVQAYSDNRYKGDEDVARLIREYNIGGIVFMQGGPVRQANMTNRYQSLARTPLMIAMDAEWGLGMRLDSTISYPRHLAMGAVQDNKLIYEMAADLARQMKRLGVHINFAPVMDVNVNPRNPVIGSRSFGEDKWNVALKAATYMQGLQDNGILAVGKHFPGHGDTDQDSHLTLPVISVSRERLDTVELVPFRELIGKGIGGIMTAHLQIPALDPTTGLAVSMSAKVVNGLLKDEMKFGGLVFSDGLNMRGVTDYFSPGQLEVSALLAGNDVLVFPPDVDKAIDAIKKALDDGILPQSLIDEKCRRVLMAKHRMGLAKPSRVNTRNLFSDLNTSGSVLIKRKISAASLTLVENRNNILPLRILDTLSIATVSIGNGQKSVFQQTLELYSPMRHFSIDKNSSLDAFNRIAAELERFNLVIVGIDDADARRSRQYGISPQTSYFIRRLAARNNVVLSLFTSPYGLAFFDDLSNISGLILAYEDNQLTQEYSAQLVFGAIPARGRLPAGSIARYPAGTGYDTNILNRLSYSIPENAGLDSRVLEGIDRIIENAISQQATPGAQVLIARRGIVVYHKAFGHHTYTRENPVKLTDLYDLASITKIAASVPAVMKLREQGRLDLGNSLGHYLPQLEGTNKRDLVIKDVLTHQSGMQSWIPFIYNTFECLVPGEELFSRRVSARYPYMLGDYMFMNRHYRLISHQFSEQAEGEFTSRVANRMFMNRFYIDSMYRRIDVSPLRSSKGYFYSDLGYYYLKRIVENISSEPLDSYTDRFLFRPLGASRLTYLPLEKYYPGEIIPTENDIIFRRQLVHGHVHDAGAAMIGGIAGHAGLFSNANDLAKLMQMFLQRGEYGGVNYFREETIREFTSAPNGHNGNRRGIGFDKPEFNSTRSPAARSASRDSFGHSGFTGTMTWVDPRDEIVYIFLSNRVHPDQFNNKLTDLKVRTSIQQLIYDAIID
jgi:beta-N-acetylhexosaminidase